MKRYVILVIDEGYGSFYVTDKEELWKEAKLADQRDSEEGLMDWLYSDSGEVMDEFEHLDDLTGIEVLGLLQVAPY